MRLSARAGRACKRREGKSTPAACGVVRPAHPVATAGDPSVGGFIRAFGHALNPEGLSPGDETTPDITLEATCFWLAER